MVDDLSELGGLKPEDLTFRKREETKQGEPSSLEPDISRKEKVYLVEKGQGNGYSQQELLQKIEVNGVNPTDSILNQIANGVRIIGLGESHKDIDTQTDHEATLFELLKAIQDKSPTKVSTLALEIKNPFKAAVEAFVKEGLPLPAELLGQHGRLFPQILEYAKSNGIQLACVDLLLNDNPQRDDAMHREVARIASINPDTVTLFYVGSGHVMHFGGTNRHHKLSDMYPRDKYLSILQNDLPRSEGVKKRTLLTNERDERFNQTPTHEYGMPWNVYGNYRATIFVPFDKNNFTYR